MKSKKVLKQPSPELVREYFDKHQENMQYQNEEEALTWLFDKLAQNKNMKDIILKVAVVNSLYNTNILATYKMAEHIRALGIDDKLKNKSPEIVRDIATLEINGKKRCHYSFATKYCHSHDRQNYPIYDRYVDKMLCAYRGKDKFCQFQENQLKDYPKFKKILEAFRTYYGLTNFTFEQIDKFLWTYGKEFFG